MSRSAHVVLVCERLDLAGGVERFVCELAGELAAGGHRVSIVNASTPPGGAHYPLPDTVQVVFDPASAQELSPTASRWRLALRQWRMGRALARLAQRARADVLVLNGLTTACSVLIAAPGLAPRSICCDHNHFFARSRPWQGLRRLLYPRVAAVVSLTEADRARYAAIQPRTEVIPNTSSLRADAPSLPPAPTVLAVGRHVAQKGLDLLLSAWCSVASACPEARLRIVGDGALGPTLRAQAQALGIEGRVDWVLPTARIEAEYRAAAVFVLPSRYEGMPLALLEAQALGVPAVAFDCPTGPREVIGPDAGLLVPPGDVAGLANALIRLLKDPDLRARLAHAALARSRSHFDPQHRIARWKALVERVAWAA